MSSFMDRIKENNNANEAMGEFIPFSIDSITYGYVKLPFAETCASYQDVFSLQQVDDKETSNKKSSSKSILSLHPRLLPLDLHARTAALATVTADLRDNGVIRGWRNELLPVVESFSSEPVLLIERAAYPFFGIKGYVLLLSVFVC